VVVAKNATTTHYFRHLTVTVAKSATVRKNKDRKL
jgi:hypothetical protein